MDVNFIQQTELQNRQISGKQRMMPSRHCLEKNRADLGVMAD